MAGSTYIKKQEEAQRRPQPEIPQWYCVKTIFHISTGKMESEIMTDEKTKIAIVIQQPDKPLDGAFEKNGYTTYYTYHDGYKEASRQLLAAMV